MKKAKDYAFVHFNTRQAAERAYEATKEHLILDNCRVEVTWSKPIDRHIHSQRKQLSKALISGNITGKGGLISKGIFNLVLSLKLVRNRCSFSTCQLTPQ